MSAGNSASGTRLGLIAMAMPAAAPDNAMPAKDDRQASRSDAVQNTAAGTSLIGQSIMNSTVGLLATSSAAIAPTARPDTRTPMPYARITSSAPQTGFTRYGPQLPATTVNSVIRSGRPGAYVGTSVWSADGR